MGKYRKFIIAMLGVVVTAIEQTIPLTPTQLAWATVITTLLTAAGVYAFPNEQGQITDQIQGGKQ